MTKEIYQEAALEQIDIENLPNSLGIMSYNKKLRFLDWISICAERINSQSDVFKSPLNALRWINS